MSAPTCSLCGKLIPESPSDGDSEYSAEHAPALQFYPKASRSQLEDRLWKVPSHRGCNQRYKLDEEYFLHYFYLLVGVQDQEMGNLLRAELRRRAKKPQTLGLIRRMVKELANVTPGGILLPPKTQCLQIDKFRAQNVVLKNSQCLFYKDYATYLPRANCVHVELCQNPHDLQESFALLCRTDPQSVMPNVFRYWSFDLDGLYYNAQLYWNSFTFCTIYRDPRPETDRTIRKAAI